MTIYKNMQIEALNKIDIKKLSIGEFQSYRNSAMNKPFSNFAKFCQGLSGHSLLLNDKIIDKWEAYYICKDVEKIIKGETKIKCIKK